VSEPMTTFTSSNDLRRPGTAFALRAVQVLTLLVLVAIGIGPLYWTVKGAVSSPTEMVTNPLRLWPAEAELGNFARAFTELHVGRYLANTVTVVTPLGGRVELPQAYYASDRPLASLTAQGFVERPRLWPEREAM